MNAMIWLLNLLNLGRGEYQKKIQLLKVNYEIPIHFCFGYAYE